MLPSGLVYQGWSQGEFINKKWGDFLFISWKIKNHICWIITEARQTDCLVSVTETSMLEHNKEKGVFVPVFRMSHPCIKWDEGRPTHKNTQTWHTWVSWYLIWVQRKSGCLLLYCDRERLCWFQSVLVYPGICKANNAVVYPKSSDCYCYKVVIPFALVAKHRQLVTPHL